MLRSAKSFFGDRLSAKDGPIGHCADFLFDDQRWVARYMVADTGAWLESHHVLISPYSLNDPDLGKHVDDIPVNLTKQQIEEAPRLDSEEPVSRRREAEMARFYHHPVYWRGEMMWGNTPFPENEEPPSPEEMEAHIEELKAIDTCHLRSAREVIGYRIEATDGEIGHVEDFILENKTWAIRYLVVDTRNWIPGRRVLIPPEWTLEIDWELSHVAVNLNREEIKESPPYDPLKAVNREYENEFYDYYGRPVYY